MNAIVVGTSEGRDHWLDNFLMSCEINNISYPIKVVHNNNFELGVINEIKDEFDEFIFVHDSCELKSNELMKFCFETHKGKSVAFSDKPNIFGMYLGKYRREILNRIDIPIPKGKLEAVELEVTWCKNYAFEDDTVLIPDPLRDGSNFVTMFDRKNMKLENDWLVKYKGAWNRNML